MPPEKATRTLSVMAAAVSTERKSGRPCMNYPPAPPLDTRRARLRIPRRMFAVRAPRVRPALTPVIALIRRMTSVGSISTSMRLNSKKNFVTAAISTLRAQYPQRKNPISLRAYGDAAFRRLPVPSALTCAGLVKFLYLFRLAGAYPDDCGELSPVPPLSASGPTFQPVKNRSRSRLRRGLLALPDRFAPPGGGADDFSEKLLSVEKHLQQHHQT